MSTAARIRRQAAAGVDRPAEAAADALLPRLPARHDRPGRDARARPARTACQTSTYGWPTTSTCGDGRPAAAIRDSLRAGHEVVDEHAEPAARARAGSRARRRQVVDAVEVLDDDALDPQVVAPDPLDELGVVPALDVDAALAGDPGARAGDGDRAGGGPPRGGGRGGGASGRTSTTGAPSTRKPGPSGNARSRPCRSSSVTTRRPALLDAHDRAAEAGLGVLDDEVALGRQLGRAARGRRRCAGQRRRRRTVLIRQPGTPRDPRRPGAGRGQEARRTGPRGQPGDAPYTWHSGQASASRPGRRRRVVRRPWEVRSVLEDRRLDVLRAIVEDYVVDPRAGRVQDAGRAAQPRRLAGDDPQRHGRARGRGLHRPAAHQRRPRPDRQGLPAVRRPALDGQAAVAGRAPGDRDASSTAPSTSTTSSARTVRLLAQLTRQVAVVQYPSLSRSSTCATSSWSRSTRAGCCSCSSPTPAGSSSALVELADDVPDDACSASCARGSTPRSPACGWPTRPTQLAGLRRAVRRRGRGRSVAAVVAALLETPRRGAARSASCIGGAANLARVRPGLPAEHPARARGARGAGRAAAAARRGDRPVGAHRAHRPREPVEGLATTSVVSVGYGTESEMLAKLGVLGPTRMDYPGRWERYAPWPATSARSWRSP